MCNNLGQYGYAFSLTDRQCTRRAPPSVKNSSLLGVCRVVNGLRGARLGAIGARVANFNTVRYSEKILQSAGISVVTVDLSEIFAVAAPLPEGDPRVVERPTALRDYLPVDDVPSDKLAQMARLAVAIDEWMDANDLDATAMQCWSSLQMNLGVSPCTIMSMMSERMMPSACEVDVAGAKSMYALQLASGVPSALVDWNNNYADDPDKCVLFHCSNWPKSMLLEAGACTMARSWEQHRQRQDVRRSPARPRGR